MKAALIAVLMFATPAAAFAQGEAWVSPMGCSQFLSVNPDNSFFLLGSGKCEMTAVSVLSCENGDSHRIELAPDNYLKVDDNLLRPVGPKDQNVCDG